MIPAKPTRHAVFFSGEPKSIGHAYRVEQPVQALRGAGWTVKWAPAADSTAHEKIDAATHRFRGWALCAMQAISVFPKGDPYRV